MELESRFVDGKCTLLVHFINGYRNYYCFRLSPGIHTYLCYTTTTNMLHIDELNYVEKIIRKECAGYIDKEIGIYINLNTHYSFYYVNDKRAGRRNEFDFTQAGKKAAVENYNLIKETP